MLTLKILHDIQDTLFAHTGIKIEILKHNNIGRHFC